MRVPRVSDDEQHRKDEVVAVKLPLIASTVVAVVVLVLLVVADGPRRNTESGRQSFDNGCLVGRVRQRSLDDAPIVIFKL